LGFFYDWIERFKNGKIADIKLKNGRFSDYISNRYFCLAILIFDNILNLNLLQFIQLPKNLQY